MIILIKVLIASSFILYSVIEGMREALYYDLKMKTNIIDLGEHTLFTVQRLVVVFFIMGAFTYMNNNFVYGFLETLSLSLIFPYFHDGAYYTARNNTNNKIYPKRWKDDSGLSTAKLEFKYPIRLSMFIISCISFLLLIINFYCTN